MSPLTYGMIAATLGVCADKTVVLSGYSWTATIIVALIVLVWVWIGAGRVVRP